MDRKGSGMRTRLPGRALLVTALALVAVLAALPAAYGADASSVRVIVGFKKRAWRQRTRSHRVHRWPARSSIQPNSGHPR